MHDQMRKKCTMAIGVLVLAVAPALAQDGWVTLFDGTNLDSWTEIGNADWTVTDDVVEGSGDAGHLLSNDSYSDFVLTLEFWVDAPANSGVFIRCADPEAVSPNTCYEVNIFDQREDQTYRTGGIVDFAAPAAQIDAGGQWNSYEIRAEGPRLHITLNGTVTVDMEDNTFAEGPFTLQYGSGIVRFRNVRIQSL